MTTKRDRKLMDALTDYYNCKDAARILGIYEQSFRKIADSGRIKAIKIGRDWFIHKDDLREYQETKSERGRPNRQSKRT